MEMVKEKDIETVPVGKELARSWQGVGKELGVDFQILERGLGVAHHRRRQILGVDLDDGDVVLAVGAHDGGVVGGVVVQRHLHGFGAVHHMGAGGDVAVLGEDHAAAAAGDLVALAVAVPEAVGVSSKTSKLRASISMSS